MATEELVCSASELPPGRVTGVGPWPVGNSKGDYFAVTRRCRHLFEFRARYSFLSCREER